MQFILEDSQYQFEDWAPDRCPVFKWVVEIWLHDWVPGQQPHQWLLDDMLHVMHSIPVRLMGCAQTMSWYICSSNCNMITSNCSEINAGCFIYLMEQVFTFFYIASCMPHSILVMCHSKTVILPLKWTPSFAANVYTDELFCSWQSQIWTHNIYKKWDFKTINWLLHGTQLRPVDFHQKVMWILVPSLLLQDF